MFEEENLSIFVFVELSALYFAFKGEKRTNDSNRTFRNRSKVNLNSSIFRSSQLKMEINDQNLEALASYLRKTLSPNGDERADGIVLNENITKKIIFVPFFSALSKF